MARFRDYNFSDSRKAVSKHRITDYELPFRIRLNSPLRGQYYFGFTTRAAMNNFIRRARKFKSWKGAYITHDGY